MTSNPQRVFKVDQLSVSVHSSISDMAQAAARVAARQLSEALKQRGEAAAILATGNSQLEFLNVLVAGQGIEWNLDWSKITLFHMDEYLGLPETHTASFRRYMQERVESKLKPKKFHYVEGDSLEPIRECERYAALLAAQPIDLCCLGIGENGHLAFNDPPVANFKDDRLVKIVRLDEACSRQQVGEGHFPDLAAVPQYAITLTIPALCQVGRILAIVPEKRKAKAVLDSLTKPVSTACPGSYLQTQPHCTVYLDEDSASLLPAHL
jgi:glucosamine-6-phosphate deaminase